MKIQSKKNTSLMLRYYLPLIFQTDHVSSQGVFNIFPGMNFRLLFCTGPHLSFNFTCF